MATPIRHEKASGSLPGARFIAKAKTNKYNTVVAAVNQISVRNTKWASWCKCARE